MIHWEGPIANIAAVETITGRFHPNPELSSTLPAHYYYDPQIFEREKQEIWFKTWQFAGFGQDLREPGDYLTNEIIDQKILVVRAKDGRLRAFYNVCMHRGHVLAEGHGNKSIFTCPFHAWSYDTTGSLKAAGNAENVAGFRLEDFSLCEIRVEELGPLVLVNLDPDAISLSEIAGDLATDWLETVPDLLELRVARHDPRVVQANWKFVLDQMECYHCPHLHKGAGFGSMAKTEWITEEHDFYAKHTIHANPDELQDDPGIIPVARPEDQYQSTKFIWYLWPGLIFVADRGRPNFKVMRVMPRGLEQSSHEVTNMCRNVPPADEDVAGMNFYRDVILPQDVDAMEKQQQGIRSRGFSQGRLMVDAARSIKSEHSTHHFDKLVWEALNGPNYV